MNTIKNVKKLFLGAGVGQMIGFFTMPIVANLYSKEQIGTAVLFVSYFTLATSFSSLGYSNALFVSDFKKYQNTLLKISVLVSLITSALIFFPIFLYLKLEVFVAILGGVVVFLGSVSIAFLNLFTVRGLFNKVRDFNLLQSSMLNPIKIILSFSPSYIMLVLSHLIRDVALLFRFYPDVLSAITYKLSFNRIIVILRRVRFFPLLNLPSVTFNTLGALFPILFIGKAYGVEYVAMYEVAHKFTTIIGVVIASSLSAVYVAGFIKCKENTPEMLRNYMVSFLKYVLPCAVFTSGFLYFFAPYLIIYLLPKSWHDSIFIVSLMALYTPFLMVGTVYGRVFTILNRQGFALAWNSLKLMLLFIVSIIYLYVDSNNGVNGYVYILVYTLCLSEVVRVFMVYFLLNKRFFNVSR